ncbi:MAG TPA: right-handed parallel beta-helix repeat-containing protein [Chthoniobacteraceae bacterium]|nr:right-handed parallel beta-helix repeat-containing protein [Chthoniobacteraceae bacterium]
MNKIVTLAGVLIMMLTASVMRAAPPTEPIGRVARGELQEARAEWWGFDAEDATECLQAAVDSGVATLIVGNTGKAWVLSRPLRLRSNQEIIFADGVVVAAKPGCFRKIGDALFIADGVENLTLRGTGTATLMMRKSDYQDATLYKPGSWRHTLLLNGVTNVNVSNLTLKESGGDGIYVGAGKKGYSENVLVEDVILDGHHRLGMAVISGENIVIRRCRFTRTKGGSPQGGLDFEPNRPTERLVNCRVEDSLFLDNRSGAAISVSPNHLDHTSRPVSVTVERCRMEGNDLGIFFYPSRASKAPPPTGKVRFVDCSVAKSSFGGVLLQDPVAKGVEIHFEKCTIDNGNARREAFVVRCERATGRAIGNLYFSDTTVIDPTQGRGPMAISYQGNGTLSDLISGELHTTKAADAPKEPFDLAAFIQAEQRKIARINAQKPATVDLKSLTFSEKTLPREDNGKIYLRGAFTFLQHAKAGDEVTLHAVVERVGNYSMNTDLELRAPDGKTLGKYSLPPDGKTHPITFTADATGIHALSCKGTVHRIDITSEHPGNGLLIDDYQTFLPIEGRLYFQVPAGVSAFTLGVSADAGADVALYDAQGREIERQNGLHSMHLFSGIRKEAAASEIWSLGVSRVNWHLTLRFNSPLAPLVSTNPHTLLLTR